MAAISNSYIITTTIVDTYFLNDPRVNAIAFAALSDGAQSWYMQKATKAIDALPLRGRKYMRDGTQDRAFPREYMTDSGWYPDCDENGTVEVPQVVLDACCEEALAIYEIQGSSDRLQRLRLQIDGVVSVNYGGTSETYVQSPSGAVSGAAGRFHGLMSKDAYDLISKYIARSFPIV